MGLKAFWIQANNTANNTKQKSITDCNNSVLPYRTFLDHGQYHGHAYSANTNKQILMVASIAFRHRNLVAQYIQ